MRIPGTRTLQILTMALIAFISVSINSDTRPASLSKSVRMVAYVTMGHGTIAPYKMLVRPGTNGTELLVVTGDGESFGTSVLHLVDSRNLIDQRPALDLCDNASGMALVGSDIAAIACRGSQSLMLADLKSWRVSAQINLGFIPIAVATVPGNAVVVSSFNTGKVCVVSVSIGSARIVRCRDVRLHSYALAADPAQHMIYDITPNFGILALNERTLTIRKAIPVQGTPSFGATMWRSQLLFTDRAGYLWVMDSGGRLQRVDLANMLGLDRAKLPPRGIDPTDILPLDHDHIIVVSGRQDSVLLAVTGTFPRLKFSRVTFLPSAVYGVYDRSQAKAFMTIPSGNRIVSVGVPAVVTRTTRWVVRKITVGDVIRYVAHRNRGGVEAVAAVDSDDNLMLVTYHQVLEAKALRIPGFNPIGPLAFAPDNALLVIGNFRGRYALAEIGLGGKLLRNYPLAALGTVFSFSRHGRHVLLVDRLAGKFGILNLDSGRLTIHDSLRARPRAGRMFGDDRMILIHDTNPDNGYSLWRDGRMTGFVSTAGLAGYPTSIKIVQGHIAVISFFGGNVINLDLMSNNILHQISLRDSHLWSLSVCGGGGVGEFSRFRRVGLLRCDTHPVANGGPDQHTGAGLHFSHAAGSVLP